MEKLNLTESPLFFTTLFVFLCLKVYLILSLSICLSEMEFPTPSAEGFTIYTKSNCPYCEKAKILFMNTVPEPVYVNCDAYLNNGHRDAFLNFIRGYTGREHRTFPMVFLRGEFIGGYTESVSFMNTNLFSSDFIMDF